MARVNGAVIFVLVGGITLAWLSAGHRAPNRRLPAIIPRPEDLVIQKAHFRLDPATALQVEDFCRSDGELLAGRLRTSTGYEIPIIQTAPGSGPVIQLTKSRAPGGLGPEGYELEVSSNKVVIRALTSAGIFYGTQSLLELLPPAVFSPQRCRGQTWSVPGVHIVDRPRFGWRGFMLDVSRHFFTTSELKQVLDLMALHKLNTFHWHLTDDQGWRIEIKKYPRLTEVGAWRKRIGFNLDPKSATAYGPDGRYGGYYSQAEIRELVAYAQRRHITIVPEIDMPGHSSAALAAYPQFSCSGGPYTTDMSEAVAAGVYCAGNPETYRFVEDILGEVMDLFPGKFIHVGGDEVCKQNWKDCPRCRQLMKREGLHDFNGLQGYFLKRIEGFVRAHGKRLVGWSEIRAADLDPGTVVMDWIGGGLQAARAGHDVVMSPEDFCYLDFYQSNDRSAEPPAAGACLTLDKIYSFEPVPAGLEPSQRCHVLGAQGNLWTEYIPALGQLEYMAFPRLSALAEVLWSPPAARNLDDFKSRLLLQEQRLDRLGVKYRP